MNNSLHQLPVLALVGRPNVGKSTLFNALTGTRDALVADVPGLTRDRQYGQGLFQQQAFLIIDTGGLHAEGADLEELMEKQVWLAVQESDLVLFVLDARDGLTAEDQRIAQLLRKSEKQVMLVINKTDGLDETTVSSDFFALGFAEMVPVSASHRRGLLHLLESGWELLPGEKQSVQAQEDSVQDKAIRLAILGRPNVGKSTLVNRLLGEERVLALDLPGTTRDTIEVKAEWDGQQYTLIDTAGVRRRARVHQAIEKFSVIKAMQAMEAANVVVLVLDANEGLTDQDTTLLGHILQSGRALVIAINKWDGQSQDQRQHVKSELERRLDFVTYVDKVTISALHGSGLKELMRAVSKAHACAYKELNTHQLTEVLQKATRNHQPPMSQGRVAKLRYAHSGGNNPPRIIIHGNRTDSLPDSYVRYLTNTFQKAFAIRGTPVVLQFRNSENPYKEKKNTLTERQMKKRQRLKKFVKRRK